MIFEMVRINSTTFIKTRGFCCLPPSPSKLPGNTVRVCWRARVPCVRESKLKRWKYAAQYVGDVRACWTIAKVAALYSQVFEARRWKGIPIWPSSANAEHREYYWAKAFEGVWAEMCLCCVPGGRGQRVWSFPLNHTRDDFVSLSSSCFVYIMLSFSFFSLFFFFHRRDREKDRNFRIKIFEPYCFACIFRFAISSGARLLYRKKQDVPGRMTQQVILRSGETRRFEGFQNGHSVVLPWDVEMESDRRLRVL